MFGWFAPKCPLDTQDKTWAERRMCWLADRLGVERMMQAKIVVPTEEFFPDAYDGSEDTVRQYFDRVCGYMGVPAHSLTMEICDDDDMPGAVGLYEQAARSNICIARSRIDDPIRLVATIAHEVAHEILLGGNLIDPDLGDHEQITDLLPVFLGMGVFPANATLRDAAGVTGNRSYFWINSQGYLSSMVLGYGLALFAHARGETSPPWASHLRPDAARTLKDGLRFLEKTGDTLFDATTARVKLRPPRGEEAAERMSSTRTSVRLNAIWDVVEYDVKDAVVMAALQRALDDCDVVIPGEAALALMGFGAAAAPAVPRLVKLLGAAYPGTRSGAARALGAIQTSPDIIVPELGEALADNDLRIVHDVAYALACFGSEARSALPEVLAALRRALLAGQYHFSQALLAALRAASDNPAQVLREYFDPLDQDLCKLALSLLKDQH